MFVRDRTVGSSRRFGSRSVGVRIRRASRLGAGAVPPLGLHSELPQPRVRALKAHLALAQQHLELGGEQVQLLGILLAVDRQRELEHTREKGSLLCRGGFGIVRVFRRFGVVRLRRRVRMRVVEAAHHAVRARALGVHERTEPREVLLLVPQVRRGVVREAALLPERAYALGERVAQRLADARTHLRLLLARELTPGFLRARVDGAVLRGGGVGGWGLHRKGGQRPQVLALHWGVAVGLESFPGGRRPRRAVRIGERFRHGASLSARWNLATSASDAGREEPGGGAEAGGRVASRGSSGSWRDARACGVVFVPRGLCP